MGLCVEPVASLDEEYPTREGGEDRGTLRHHLVHYHKLFGSLFADKRLIMPYINILHTLHLCLLVLDIMCASNMIF